VSCINIEDENKMVDLNFYTKNYENDSALFLDIRNLSHCLLSEINGFLTINDRKEAKVSEPFKVPNLKTDEKTGVFLAFLKPMTKYYVDVKISYNLSNRIQNSRLERELMIP
jgi:hypothetical protein